MSGILTVFVIFCIILIKTYYNNAERIYKNGLKKFNSKDYKGAIKEFSKVIKLDTNYYIAYWYRGSAYSALKQYSNAVKDYEKVFKLNQDFPSYFYEELEYAKYKVNASSEEFIKVITQGTLEEVKEALSKIDDIKRPVKYEDGDMGHKSPVYILDIALLDSNNIEVIKLLLEKGAIGTIPLSTVIQKNQTVGIFTLCCQYNYVKETIYWGYILDAIKNPNPEILKEVLNNKKIQESLKTAKNKGTTLKKYFEVYNVENIEDKYKILDDFGY